MKKTKKTREQTTPLSKNRGKKRPVERAVNATQVEKRG